MANRLSTPGTLSFRTLLALFLLYFLAPAISWSASPAPSDDDASNDADISATPVATDVTGSNSLENLHKTEVVYTAATSEAKTTDALGSTTIITSTEIKVGGFRTLDDLLSYVRGFFITNDRNYSYVGLRGFGSLGGYNSPILLLVDGHKINDNIYGEFYSDEAAIVDMDTIDHVEIIRGPASVVYGNSAIFGVINVVTKQGKDLKGMILSGQGGSLDTVGGGVLDGGQTDSGLQWTLQGSAYYSGGNASLYFPEWDTPGNNVNNGIAQNCDGENAQHAFLHLILNDWSLETALMHRYKQIPTGEYGTDFDNPNSFTEDTDFFTELNYRHGDPEQGQWRGRLSLDMADYTGNYIVSGITNLDNGDGAWATGSLQYVFTPFYRNKFTLGAEFIDNFEQWQKNFNLGMEPYLNDAPQSTQWSFYAQDEIKLRTNLLLCLGGRYEYFSTAGGQFVPRGALIWDPVQSTVLKLVAGEAYAAPNAFQLYYDDLGPPNNPNPNASQDENANLKNEVFETYEFDLEQALNQNHRVLFSLYHYVGENLILGVPEANNPNVNVYENIGHNSLNGLEFEYQYTNASGIQGRLSWAYQRDQDDTTGQVLPFSPQNLGKANLQVPIDARLLTVQGECQFTGSSKGTSGVWVPDATIFNLKFYSPHFIWENVEANLTFYNLFNTAYYDPANDNIYPLQSIQQNGLVIWGKLSYKL